MIYLYYLCINKNDKDMSDWKNDRAEGEMQRAERENMEKVRQARRDANTAKENENVDLSKKIVVELNVENTSDYSFENVILLLLERGYKITKE